MLTAEVKQALTPPDAGTTLIITVGNPWRRDDGVGPYIAARCHQLKEGFALIDAGDKPEFGVERAIDLKPARAVIIDAADFGGALGEARLIPTELIPETALSTHSFPLPIIAKMIEADAGAQVAFLGIQPARVDLGEGLCDEVTATADELIELIAEG